MIPRICYSFESLEQWCIQYHNGPIVPQPKHIRFSIAIYQISQGMSWNIGNPVRWQSFCSAAMHFIMCSNAYGLQLSQGFPADICDISSDFRGWEYMLFHIGKCQQQIMYEMSKTTTRASRYSETKFHVDIHRLVEACFSLCPNEYRPIGCWDEMLIMTKDLPKATPSVGETR